MSPAAVLAVDTAFQWTYVVLGWGVVLAVLAGYSLWVLRKGRALSRRVDPEERRWM